jgi:hypothetical protein
MVERNNTGAGANYLQHPMRLQALHQEKHMIAIHLSLAQALVFYQPERLEIVGLPRVLGAPRARTIPVQIRKSLAAQWKIFSQLALTLGVQKMLPGLNCWIKPPRRVLGEWFPIHKEPQQATLAQVKQPPVGGPGSYHRLTDLRILSWALNAPSVGLSSPENPTVVNIKNCTTLGFRNQLNAILVADHLAEKQTFEDT